MSLNFGEIRFFALVGSGACLRGSVGRLGFDDFGGVWSEGDGAGVAGDCSGSERGDAEGVVGVC